MMYYLDRILSAIVLMIAFYVIFFIGKLVHGLIHKDYQLNEELVEKDNPALSLAIGGYYFGLVLAIGGTLVGSELGLMNDLMDLLIYGLLAIILLNISWFICDKIMLHKFQITDELIRDRNQGTGAIVCGMNIASGFVIYGAVSGDGGNIWTATVFWGIGQVMLILAGVVYGFIVPYSLHQEIEKDNVAAGVSFAGAIIAMGIIIGLVAECNFFSWWNDLPRYLIISILGLLMLPGIRFLTDKILFPTVNLTDEIANQEVPNVGAAYIEAFSYLSAALLFYWCI